ncbi:SusC/RagA family TonB-linked outer membrane protein [Ekhidna sp. MALMAid0563]|uniref:SusC/RagA family TonB-linked outer membrane protein n=1 Tax=Ekhidna sp. MALMAid0563 TaxID=3143937 RepID=UPI0032DF9600
MKRILLLSFAFLTVVAFSAMAQRTVSGKVTDDTGEALPGVNVVIKGTTTGVTTDLDGNYRLSVDDGATLIFSYVGFETQEIEIGSRTTIDVTLGGATELSEVVVLGYSDASKDRITSAVSVVDNSEIESFNATTSIDQILQGKASGVSVTGANGRPGQTALVNIRGITSIEGGTDPLYIVDGVPVDPSNVNNINPSDIESVSILKDAATAALYGSRAGNGVVVITTKTGKKGDAQVSFRSSLGISSRIPDNFEMMDAQQKLTYEYDLDRIPGFTAAAARPGALGGAGWDPYLNRNTNWEDELLQDGSISNMSLSINGGTDNGTYFFSVSRDANEGLISGLDGFERYSTRLNLTQQVKDYLKIGTNLTVSRSESDLPRDRFNVQNPFVAMYTYNPYETVYVTDDNGDPILDENGDPEYDPSGIGGFSISEALKNNTETTQNLVTIGSVYGEVSFLKNFTNRVTVGISNDRYSREYFIKPGSILDQFVGDADAPGIKTDNTSNDYRVVATNLLTYSNTFADVHNVTVRGLYEYNKRQFSSFGASSKGFVTDRLSVPNVAAAADGAPFGTKTANILASYGAFINYSYDDRYVLDVSLRRDGSSRFGKENRWGTFYAVSGAWNIHNESFFNVDFINSAKLRASIGTSGNNRIGDFSSLSLIQFGSRNGQSTVIPVGEADQGLQWEAQQIIDIGLETTFWDNRITLVADYFKRTSSELLGEQPLSQTVGDENNVITTNLGEIQTTGLEFELSADVVATGDLLVRAGGNIFFLNTKVNELSGGSDIFNTYTILREGEEINTFFLNRYAGVNPANGAPLWYNADGEVTSNFSGDDAVLLEGKSPQADYQGGFFVSARYKGLDFRADAVFRAGNYIYNVQEAIMLNDGTDLNDNQRVDAFNYWKAPGDTGVLPSPLYGQEAARTSDRFLQKGDYIRLRNLTLGYTLPKQILSNVGLTYVRIFVQGQNLLTYRPYFKGDPEVGIGSGETLEPGDDGFVAGESNGFSYPNSRIYTGGIEIRF